MTTNLGHSELSSNKSLIKGNREDKGAMLCNVM